MAVAREQEMKAATQEMRAKVVEAEAAVPIALAQALREGNIGAMDYYQLQNLLADTQMRDTISQLNPKDQGRNEPISGK
jgi:uncharacterized protein YqfA (UPF0365 family)